MVWDNWNPLKDVRDEWRDSSNFWGKIKVFLFYTYVWIIFLYVMITMMGNLELFRRMPSHNHPPCVVVVSFYFVALVSFDDYYPNLRDCVYQVFVPWSLGNSCFIATSTKNQDAITFFIRQYDIIFAAWLLYVAKAKTTLPNLRAFFAILLVACVVACMKEGQTLFEEGPCGETWMAQWYYWLGWPFVALVCAYLERFVERRTSTAAERQALV
jgi:hypothetical protein